MGLYFRPRGPGTRPSRPPSGHQPGTAGNSRVYWRHTPDIGGPLAKPNYSHQKKQKELARQARQNEKLKKRQARSEESAAASGAEAAASPTTGAPTNVR
jgi:hypothetical protein